jgi:hypothetical protein
LVTRSHGNCSHIYTDGVPVDILAAGAYSHIKSYIMLMPKPHGVILNSGSELMMASEKERNWLYCTHGPRLPDTTHRLRRTRIIRTFYGNFSTGSLSTNQQFISHYLACNVFVKEQLPHLLILKRADGYVAFVHMYILYMQRHIYSNKFEDNGNGCDCGGTSGTLSQSESV